MSSRKKCNTSGSKRPVPACDFHADVKPEGRKKIEKIAVWHSLQAVVVHVKLHVRDPEPRNGAKVPAQV